MNPKKQRGAYITSYVFESVKSDTGQRLAVYFFYHICPIVRCEERKYLVQLTELLLCCLWGQMGDVWWPKTKSHCELMVQWGAAN